MVLSVYYISLRDDPCQMALFFGKRNDYFFRHINWMKFSQLQLHQTIAVKVHNADVKCETKHMTDFADFAARWNRETATKRKARYDHSKF